VQRVRLAQLRQELPPPEEQQALEPAFRLEREPQELPLLQELQPPALPAEQPLASAPAQLERQLQPAARGQGAQALGVQQPQEDAQSPVPPGPCWQWQVLRPGEPRC